MFDVITDGDSLRVIYNGRIVIEHSPDEPFAWAGKGRWKITEELVSDRLSEQAPLTRAHYDRQWSVLRLSGGDFSLTFHLEERDGALRVSPQRSTTGLNRLRLRFPSDPGESVYGAGAQYEKLDLRGERIPLWVRDQRVFSRNAPTPSVRFKGMQAHPSAFPVPVFFTGGLVWHSFECTAPAIFDFTGAKEHRVELWELPSSFTIGTASSPGELTGALTRHMGHQPILPHWVTEGVCLEVSGGSHKLAQHVEGLAGAKISSLCITDWSGTRETKDGSKPFYDWIWNMELYPKLDTLISGLATRNVRTLAYVAPHFSIEGRLYAEAATNGFLIKKPQGGHYIHDIGGFMAGHLDLSNSAACAWFRGIIKDNILGLGFCGSEAAMGSFLPPDAILSSGENPLKMRGRWPVLWAKLNREAIREAGRSTDSVFISRTGGMGSSRHSMIASTGEHHTSWNRTTGMQSALTAALSLSCSGMGISVAECGGNVRFMGSRSKELLMRWHDLGAFAPIFRTRIGEGGGWQPDTDRETLEHFIRMTRAHNVLAPYIRSCIKENASVGMPALRPLFMQFPEDEKLRGAQDSYMLGGELLVAPVFTKGQKNRKVYLPEGHWIELWNGRAHSGGELVVSTPFGKPPAFYRSDGKNADIFDSFERKLRD